MGQLIRSAALLAVALLVMELRSQSVLGDALAVPLVALFVLGFLVSVLWTVRGRRRLPEPAQGGLVSAPSGGRDAA